MHDEIAYLGLHAEDPAALADSALEEQQRVTARQHFWLTVERVRRQYAEEFPDVEALRFTSQGDAGDGADAWSVENASEPGVPLLDDSTPVFHLQAIGHAIYQDGFGATFVLDLTRPALLDPVALDVWLAPATTAQEGTGLWRTVYAVEVLADRLIPDDLGTLAAETLDGGASGMVEVASRYELSRESMALRLVAQGSDPEFLVPDHDAEW